MVVKRGRKSAAELEALDTYRAELRRPEPPKHLSREAKEVWLRITNSLPKDWFAPETHDLLADYCGNVVLCRKLDKIIAKLPLVNADAEYDRWVKHKERASKVAGHLATKMRLTQQSSFDKRKVKTHIEPDDDPW